MKKSLLILLVSLLALNVNGQGFKLKKDSLISINDFQQEFEFEKNTEPVVAGAENIEEEPLPNALKNVFDRLYISNIGIEAFRENLDELLGRVAFKDNNIFNLGLLNIKKDTSIIKSFIPKQGKLISHKLTKKSSATLSFFINASATDERIYEYYVSDMSRAILEYKNIDKDLLKKLVTNIANDADLKNYYLVTGVTVTEIFRRQFDKKERKIKADNFPISGTAISFGGSFFVSDENFEREYKIGLTTSRLDVVKNEVNALLGEK